MSTKDETFQLAAEELLEHLCRFLDRELPPPPGWTSTELKNIKNPRLSVSRVQSGGGVDPATVGKWTISAGPTPRDPAFFDESKDAMFRVTTLAQIEAESRA